MRRPCSIDGCEKPMKTRGWCGTHYERWRLHGDPVWAPPTPEARFWEKVRALPVADPNACWLWTASRYLGGYGQLWVDGRLVPAHRFAYELLTGPIPEGLQLDHLCRVPACVNPDHLEPVTQRENILRGEAPSAKHAIKTHCPHGHPFSPENTYVRPSGRACRACGRARGAARLARKRSERAEAGW